MSLYLGIDPGVAGAIAPVNADGRFVIDEGTPTTARGHGRVRHEVDAGAIANLLRPQVKYFSRPVPNSTERISDECESS
jgi:hypothetical protein